MQKGVHLFISSRTVTEQIFWLETIGTMEQIFTKMCVLGAEIYPEPEKIEHAKYFKKVSEVSRGGSRICKKGGGRSKRGDGWYNPKIAQK